MTLPHVHLVDVSAYGVYLAVVGEIPERLRERPRGERVRGVPLVDKAYRALIFFVGQIGVKIFELRGVQKPLVNDSPRRHRADVKVVARPEAALRRVLRDPAQNVESALESLAREPAFGEEHLLDSRAGLERGSAYRRLVYRDLARAENFKALRLRRAFQNFEARFRVGFFLRQKEHRRGVFAERRQLKRQNASKKFVGNLRQYSRAVARLQVRPDRAAVQKPVENFYSVRHRFVRAPRVYIDNQPDAAGVVFVPRIVKPPGMGEVCLFVCLHIFQKFYVYVAISVPKSDNFAVLFLNNMKTNN